MRRPIEKNSSRGQVVYDPFCGSGTTIIAAEQTGRACHAIEIAPAYVDVAVKRWQAFTGLEAKLDATGRYLRAEISQAGMTCEKRRLWVVEDVEARTTIESGARRL
jgi:DNA modification methylase